MSASWPPNSDSTPASPWFDSADPGQGAASGCLSLPEGLRKLGYQEEEPLGLSASGVKRKDRMEVESPAFWRIFAGARHLKETEILAAPCGLP